MTLGSIKGILGAYLCCPRPDLAVVFPNIEAWGSYVDSWMQELVLSNTLPISHRTKLKVHKNDLSTQDYFAFQGRSLIVGF